MKRGRHENGSRQQERRVEVSAYYFPPNASVPTELSADFPRLPYATRRGQVKSAAHWGQRKLLLSEVQLLIEALEAMGPTTKFHIVYAGAAPGEHLAFLDRMFPGHRWELIDPIKFHDCLRDLPNFTLRNKYFVNRSAYAMTKQRMEEAKCPALAALYGNHFLVDEDDDCYRTAAPTANLIEGVEAVAQPPLPPPPSGIAALFQVALRRVPQLFVCDIRSGSLMPQGGGGGGGDDSDDEGLKQPPQEQQQQTAPSIGGGMSPFESFERHVADDMAAQQTWVEIMQPTFALLKFRLPYMEVYHPITKEVVYRHPSATTSYLRGKVLLPIWSRPTTTECRLLVPQGALRIEYDNRAYEDQCFFFNSVLREKVHFRHLLESAPKDTYLDHRFDATAEVDLLQRYLAMRLAPLPPINDCAESDSAFADVVPPPGAQNDPNAVLHVSRAITASLHRTFEQAAERLNRVRMEKANAKGFVEAEKQLQRRIADHREAPVWWTNNRVGGVTIDSVAEFWAHALQAEKGPRT